MNNKKILLQWLIISFDKTFASGGGIKNEIKC